LLFEEKTEVDDEIEEECKLLEEAESCDKVGEILFTSKSCIERGAIKSFSCNNLLLFLAVKRSG